MRKRSAERSARMERWRKLLHDDAKDGDSEEDVVSLVNGPESKQTVVVGLVEFSSGGARRGNLSDILHALI